MSELGQKIIAETRKVAAGNPDFVYQKISGACKYVRNGNPDCIIGHALWNVGLIDADCPWDGYGVSSISNVIRDVDWGKGLDSDEVGWLSIVQDSQDTGYSWREAIAKADREDPEEAPEYIDNDWASDEDV